MRKSFVSVLLAMGYFCRQYLEVHPDQEYLKKDLPEFVVFSFPIILLRCLQDRYFRTLNASFPVIKSSERDLRFLW